MQIRIRWTLVGLWLLAGCIAALSCSLIRPAVHIGNDYFPMGNDSFYHAARILEAAQDPAAFYEFDPKIHAPEGSLLVWPWGYDFVLAKVVRAGVALGAGDPLTILSWIPVTAAFVGLALLMLVARRLSLGEWPTALAALCMALNQTTQMLYGYGQIDHHYAEHIFILASLAAGLGWFRNPTVTNGAVLGAIFAVALAVHNALFVLQVPFLATVLALWLQGKSLPMRPALAFGGALLGFTVAVLVPSQPFQEGRFEFYTLSWFHLYIVFCTTTVVLLMTRLPATRRNILILTAIAVALLLPLLNQIRHAQAFVSGSLGMLADIMEMRPPLKFLLEGQWKIGGFYSWLLFLAPATFVLCVIRAWRERNQPRLLFWIWCIFGLALMFMQLRMHYFGGFALYLPWLIVTQEHAFQHPDQSRRTWLIVSLLLVLAYVPVIRYALIEPVPRAGDPWFDHLYPSFAPLREACAKDPGVVLADNNAGHYIRYFTHCSVIANNFLLTEQQFAKVAEITRLFSLTPEELLKQAPYVKYVLVRAANIRPKPDGQFSYSFYRDATRLPQALLLSSAEPPPGFRLLFKGSIEVRQQTTQNIPYVRLYKIERASGSSVNDVGE